MASFQALGELRDQVLAGVSVAASTASEEVVAFFSRLRTELMFFRGCLNLKDTLAERGCLVVLPELVEEQRIWEIDGLYDAGLVLDGHAAVPSDFDGGTSLLTVVTGANRGGKSTFLRATGIAALLARSGCFVPATHMRCELPTDVHTHFLREEDDELLSGKLDEELSRLSVTVGRLRHGAVLLCNESFSSTNEREGGQIGTGVLEVLVDAGVRVVVVTHMFELAQSLWTGDRPATFLRAELDSDGNPSLRIVPGVPEPTSHADVVFRRVFGQLLEGPAKTPIKSSAGGQPGLLQKDPRAGAGPR
jgi:DNA mismatch repair ATPase MutS